MGSRRLFLFFVFFVQESITCGQGFNELQSWDTLKKTTQMSRNTNNVSVRNHIYIDGDTILKMSSTYNPKGFFIFDGFLDKAYCDTLAQLNIISFEEGNESEAIDCNYYSNVDTFKNCFEGIEAEGKYSKYTLKKISYFKSAWLKKNSFPFSQNSNSLIIHTYSSKRSEVFVFGVDLEALDKIYFSKIVLNEGKPEVLSKYHIPLWKSTQRQIKKFKKKTTAECLKRISDDYISSVKFSKLASDFIVAEFYYEGNYCPFLFSVRDKPPMKKELRKTKILYFLGDIYFPVLNQYGYVW